MGPCAEIPKAALGWDNHIDAWTVDSGKFYKAG